MKYNQQTSTYLKKKILESCYLIVLLKVVGKISKIWESGSASYLCNCLATALDFGCGHI